MPRGRQPQGEHPLSGAERQARYRARLEAQTTSPVLPVEPGEVFDIGSGTGRAAAWLGSLGDEVVGVEPSGAMRAKGASLHQDPRLRWFDDRLRAPLTAVSTAAPPKASPALSSLTLMPVDYAAIEADTADIKKQFAEVFR